MNHELLSQWFIVILFPICLIWGWLSQEPIGSRWSIGHIVWVLLVASMGTIIIGFMLLLFCTVVYNLFFS
ncbi:hypothetical protein C121_29 [Stenotrophomonas phage C121]|uniref:hypothetical protein n=1 Tax=Stenotrophomonas phage C121 TaxID=2914029 RepID=UPI0023294BD7|nr:hypothetical protein PP752_gp29 [Stenotrophomonas phage C121]UKL14762.1 hypothetical protein C121_29 [Stenotrophomonas phage C121]